MCMSFKNLHSSGPNTNSPEKEKVLPVMAVDDMTVNGERINKSQLGEAELKYGGVKAEPLPMKLNK